MTTRRERAPRLDTLLTLDVQGAVSGKDTDSYGQPVTQRELSTTVTVWGGLIERVGGVVQPEGEAEHMRDRSEWVVRFSPQWRVGSTFSAWARKWRVMSMKQTADRRYLTLECEGA